MLSPQAAVSPREVFHLLDRHKGKMVVFFVAVMTIAGAIALFFPRAYRSQAKLLVRLGRENAALDPTVNFGQAPVLAVPVSRENDVNSALEILTSRFLIEKVVDSIGPDVILGSLPVGGKPVQPPVESVRQKAIDKVSRKLEVEAVKRSNIIALTYDGPSQEVAQAVVSHLVDFYLDRYAHLHRTPEAHRFLADQAERMHAQLMRTEEELRRKKEETGLFVPEGQRQSLIARIALIDEDLLRTAAAKAGAEGEIKVLRDKLNEIPRTQVLSHMQGLPNQVTEVLRGQLFTLRQKELDLLARHGPDHADVRMVREQVAATKESISREEQDRKQITTGPTRPHEEGQIELLKQEGLLASLIARSETLHYQSKQERAALQDLNRHELEIARLQREVELQTLQYRKYAESREQAEIDRSLEAERISNISIVQPATSEPEPVRPRPWLIMGLALVIAVVGSSGLAVLCENYLKEAVTNAGSPPAHKF